VTRPIRGAPEADAEFADAVRWYEEQRTGLGSEFLAAVREARKLIEDRPGIGATMRGAKRGERRLMVRRFPYQLIYYVRSHDIVLVAVAHTKRRPGYWKRRAIPRAT
jgi:toxin ParE1/3/4